MIGIRWRILFSNIMCSTLERSTYRQTMRHAASKFDFSYAVSLQQLACAACLLCAGVATAQEPELIVEVDRQEIYQGESFIYDVTLNHIENPSPPSLDNFDAFQVESLGQQSLNSQQISIINGVRSEVIRRGMLYRFRLTPTKSGRQKIPAPEVEIDGEKIVGRELTVNVVAPEDQDIVLLEMAVDKPFVYPLQPFKLTLTIAVKQLPGAAADQSPLAVQGNDPVRLTLPWMDDDQIPDGLKPKTPWNQILQPLLSRSSRRETDGMRINNFGTQSAFAFFGRERTTVFLPDSKPTTRPNSDGDEVGYVEYTLERIFIPQKIGEFRFAPANMKGTFGTEFAGSRLKGEDIYAVSNPVIVKVKDVPPDGRPASYIGGVVTFDVSADVAPRTASVGDPLTLTVTIHGEGTIGDLRPPVLETLDGFTDKFRTYEATEETVGNGRVFTYSLRPLSENVSQLPPIPVSWFDVDKEQYVVEQTEPIPLTISAAKQLSASSIVASSGSGNEGGNSLEVNDTGLFANHTSLKDLRAIQFSASRWLSIWGTMIVGYIVLNFGIRHRQKMHSDPAILRRRNARSQATESLKAITAAAGDESRVSPDALNKIVTGLISDFTGFPQAGMTSHDAGQHLATVGIEPDLARRTVDFMQSCDAARYGAGAADSTSLVASCRQLVDELGRELNKRC